jgi:hypothetical protein
MALSSSAKRLLKRKADDDSLEVEDLLRVIARAGASDASFLRRLKDENGWPDAGWMNGSRVVPFGRWVDVICCYLERGYAGLVESARARTDNDVAMFCVGLLEELKTPASVAALLAIGENIIERPEADRALSLRLARAFNLVLSFKDAPEVDREAIANVREFLHRTLLIDLSEAERAACVYALRSVGDSESLRLIATLPIFQGPYAGLEASASKAIKQNLRRWSRETPGDAPKRDA